MKIKALTVENNPVLLKAIATILEQTGCEVRTASTGLEALEVLDTYEPDIVFTDLIMPEISGEQLCRRLRSSKKHAGVFIVVLSAIVVEDRERILREVACDICIAKGSLVEIKHHIVAALESFSLSSEQSKSKITACARIPKGLKPSSVASELLLEKHHLSVILDNLDEGILELNTQGKIIAANRSALKILSRREEELTGIFFADAGCWAEYQKTVLQWIETELTGQGGGVLELLEDTPLTINNKIVTAVFIPVLKPERSFGLCILRDISRQAMAEKQNKELDEALKLVKKMDAMSIMAGGVAHDFNNLLTVICGNLDIITFLWESQATEDRMDLLQQARKAALVAVDLTRQISCFSNFGIITRKEKGFVELVSEGADIFFSYQISGFTLNIKSDPGNVSVDPEEITEAINSVLQNALEASTGNDVQITISAESFTKPQMIASQYVPAGTYARLDVQDFGEGIDSEILFKIFDPYYSSKERGALKGMGLGLTVVYATLRNHGGHVVVDSNTGEGTTVSFFLPVAVEGQSQKGKLPDTILDEHEVILIEPDLQMREIGKIMLDHLGFSVSVAEDRKTGVNHLERLIGNNNKSPLVILDLPETKGESAIETCRLLKQIDKEIKVIAMSGAILDPVVESCRDYGFADTLAKPYSMDSLRHTIYRVLCS